MQWFTHQGGVQSLLRGAVEPGTIRLAWLGQAGFTVKTAQHVLLIDPYLSDFLAKKYQGKELSYTRLMRSPIDSSKLRGVDAVFCTHRHSDHMDPDTLPLIAKLNPSCLFVVPRAEQESAERAGLPPERLLAMDADETVTPFAGLHVYAIASAHETLDVNNRGEHHFLGYVFRSSGLTLYHSGDCVPYDELDERLRHEQIDLAMLPINGRDEYRRSRGVPGNMTFDEAYTLCRAAAISRLVPHHYGMFEFNTLDSQELAERVKNIAADVQVIVPHLSVWFELKSGNDDVALRCPGAPSQIDAIPKQQH